MIDAEYVIERLHFGHWTACVKHCIDKRISMEDLLGANIDHRYQVSTHAIINLADYIIEELRK